MTPKGRNHGKGRLEETDGCLAVIELFVLFDFAHPPVALPIFLSSDLTLLRMLS